MDDSKKEHNRSELAAYEEGREARMKGKARTSVPQGYRVAKSLRKAFESGWDDGIVTPEPTVRVQEPEIRTRSDGVVRLEAGEALPEHYPAPVRREPTPCRHCRAVRLANGSQAVIVEQTWEGIAYLRCRCCSKQFKLPIR